MPLHVETTHQAPAPEKKKRGMIKNARMPKSSSIIESAATDNASVVDENASVVPDPATKRQRALDRLDREKTLTRHSAATIAALCLEAPSRLRNGDQNMRLEALPLLPKKAPSLQPKEDDSPKQSVADADRKQWLA